MTDIVVYDIEIENAIPDNRTPIVPNIRYCGGWHDFQGMGIAVVTAYEYSRDRYRIFFKDNLSEFDALQRSADVLVGFNSKRFDDLVLACNGVVINTAKVFDILPEIWKAAGLPEVKHRDDFDRKLHGGYNLDSVAYINTGQRKSGQGAYAPILWQQGKRGEVVDYGLGDVWLTKLVLDKILDNGALKDPKSGRTLDLRWPMGNLTEQH